MNSDNSPRSKTYKITVCALFAALICLLSIISIPFGSIPVTLSVLAIFLTGALLSPKYALISVVCYMLIGAVGLPVFSGFNGGLGALFGVTGGYLLSYPFMVLALSLTVKLFKKKTFLSLMCGSIFALLLCYALGTIWFSRFAGKSLLASLMTCVVPFIGFDLAKMLLAIFITLRVQKTPIKDRLI